MCIAGGIVSDAFGKFTTILNLLVVYIIGCAAISLSAIPSIGVSPKVILFVGLILISIGSGGISPCISAFAGDQFKLPEQEAQLNKFFSMFYFVIVFATLISTTLSPILRSDVHCFGANHCYSLAFGAPAIMITIATGESVTQSAFS